MTSATRLPSRGLSWFLAAAASLAVVAPCPLAAQPLDSVDPAPRSSPGKAKKVSEVDLAIAGALLERAEKLFAQGDYKNARTLLLEALRRSPNGPHADNAIGLLRATNEKLGLDADDGIPPNAGTTSGDAGNTDGNGTDALSDPYGETSNPLGGNKGDGDWGEPADPYSDGENNELDSGDATGADILEEDPDGADPDDEVALADVELEQIDDDEEPEDPELDRLDDLAMGRRVLLIYGGAYGFLTGLALAGPQDEFGDTDGSAIWLAGAGAGAGMLGGYYLAKRGPYTEGQAMVISWSGIWSGASLGYMSDLVSGVDRSSTNDIYKGLAIGSLIGTGAGVIVANRYDPSVGDVALVNSLGLYGMSGALLLGLGLDPTESEAYSINALVGTALGLAAGIYAAKNSDVSRQRMLWVDIGAAVGAAVPWVVIYPLVDGDGSSSATQVTGVLSLIGLATGAYFAWNATNDMDGKKSDKLDEDELDEDELDEDELDEDELDEDDETQLMSRRGRAIHLPPPPGLIQRRGDGTWTIGLPAFRPAENPALAPRLGKPGFAVDVLSGRF